MRIRRYDPSEPISVTRHIPIEEVGEPLVSFLGIEGLVFDRPYFKYERVAYARASVVEMLAQAAALLVRQGFQLGVIEGWRPLHIQRRMNLTARRLFQARNPDWPASTVARMANRLSAPVVKGAPPPHLTGGAVDVRLLHVDGSPADMVSPYDPDDVRVYSSAVRGLSSVAQRHREAMFSAMAETGLTNYPSEYWHWTYGDQGWAYRGGHPAALYGFAAPEGYVAPAEEMTDEPLERW